MGDPTTCVEKFIYYENDSVEPYIIQFLLCMYWDYGSR